MRFSNRCFEFVIFGILPILMVGVFFILNGCSVRESQNNKTVFRYNESAGIPTLDPAFARNQVINWATNQLFNGLVQINDTLGIEACIAKNWDISGDGLEYTFILRGDVCFHPHEAFANSEGRVVNAQDFVYSFNRIMEGKTASPGAWIFNMVDFSDDRSFKAMHDTILKIYLNKPFPGFLGVLTMQYCSVVPKEVVEYYGADFGRFPIGTGPFIFKYWKDGEKLIFVKNEKYFEKDNDGEKLPYLDAVSISFIKDKQSEFLEFLKGNIDFLSGVHTSYKNELITPLGNLNPKYVDRFKMTKANYLNTEYLAIFHDTTKEVLADSPLQYKEIRQAINLGFNRDKMMRYMRNNIGMPAHGGFIPQGLAGFVDSCGYNYDPVVAKTLVDHVKKRVGELSEITLTTTSEYLDLCEFIQHELEGIGLEINIEVSVGATFRSSVANSKLPFFRASWVADYPDAENYLALFYSKNFSPGGPNYTHFKNEVYDGLYEQSLQETDFNKRLELYKKMDGILMDKAVIVPLYYDQVVRFTQKNIENFSANPINLLVLKRVRKVS